MTTAEKYIKENNLLNVTPEEILFLSGLIMGDGAIVPNGKNGSKTVTIGTHIEEWDLLEEALKIFRKLPHNPNYRGGKINKSKNKNLCYITDCSFYKILTLYGNTNTENKQKISKELREESLSARCAWLSAFFTSDGNITSSPGKKYISVKQRDQKPLKWENKKECLEFSKEILKEIGVESTIDYSIKKSNFGTGKIANLGDLRVLPSKNPDTFSILRKHLYFRNKKKDNLLDELVAFENKKKQRIKKIKNIKMLLNEGKSYSEISELLNVPKHYIGSIKRGAISKHIVC